MSQQLKLNYGRTFCIGLAFMGISAFWQLYDNIIPLILKNTFAMEETITGVIMAADNILAVVLLPFLGAWSDRVDTCQRREKNNVKRRVEIDANAGITIGGYLPPVNCSPEYASAERVLRRF